MIRRRQPTDRSCISVRLAPRRVQAGSHPMRSRPDRRPARRAAAKTDGRDPPRRFRCGARRRPRQRLRRQRRSGQSCRGLTVLISLGWAGDPKYRRETGCSGPLSAASGWPLVGPASIRAAATPYAAGHRGVDLAATSSQPVLAARGGRVQFAGPVAGRGVVVIAHADGIRTEYEPVCPDSACRRQRSTPAR